MAKEYIERDAMKQILEDLHFKNYGYAIMAVMEAPTADVVEVVRCKDCKFSDDGFICNGNGHMREHVTLPHKYCADGERRDNNEAD